MTPRKMINVEMVRVNKRICIGIVVRVSLQVLGSVFLKEKILLKVLETQGRDVAHS